ncbi:MAG TPA: protein-L-isoaspartate O-methyltransferase [Stellaceae bacterium]|jgi:protein-L-isoaspartate(D-aspartate) O-methyltransferase|nr:protein-L-isoaspartate O-methyltransferase [Stellaceae bacterium]
MNFAAARLNMVESQLRTNKVVDEALLDAFLMVPRERFVPVAFHDTAYFDDDLPLGNGRSLLEPMILARMLSEAHIGPADNVLDIGCATGYGVAIVARIAAQVIGVEQDGDLARDARARLAELGVLHAAIVEAKLPQGHAAEAPYNVIVIEGAVADIPDALAAQLAEGGRLVTVVRTRAGIGQANLMTRIDGALSRRPLFDAATPFLPGFAPAPSFVF